MQFRKFKQNKLWRDKAVESMQKMGSKIHWKQLNDREFSNELKLKFIEESQEVCDAKTKDELVEELGDILEVITAMANAHNFTMQDILAAQEKKREERGGFENRNFVTIAEHPLGSFGEKYCLAAPEKYPEILD